MQSILGSELSSIIHDNERGALLLTELLHYKGNQLLLLLASCLLHYKKQHTWLQKLNVSLGATVTYFIKRHWKWGSNPNTVSLPMPPNAGGQCQEISHHPQAVYETHKSQLLNQFLLQGLKRPHRPSLFNWYFFKLLLLHIFFKQLLHPETTQPIFTYYQVISRFSFIVPRSLISTATTWGRAANRSFVSQVTLPTRMWVASPFTSVTCRREEQDI